MPRPTTTSLSTTAQPSMTFEIVPFATDEHPSAIFTRPAMTMQANIISEQIVHRYTSAAPPPQVEVEDPVCFGRVNGGYSCFGKLWNRSEQSIGSISLKVEILNSNYQSLTEQTFSLEQSLIPQNTFASYRILFDSFSGEKKHIRTTIMQQVPTSLSQSALKIVDERGLVMESGRYRLTATIENNLDKNIDDIRVFATLMNPEHEIVGYRIYEINGTMQATERKVVDFEIIPHIYANNLSHVLHVEGQVKDSFYP